jgi:hypothetical protein
MENKAISKAWTKWIRWHAKWFKQQRIDNVLGSGSFLMIKPRNLQRIKWWRICVQCWLDWQVQVVSQHFFCESEHWSQGYKQWYDHRMAYCHVSNNLLVHYSANEKAWMTSDMSEVKLRHWDFNNNNNKSRGDLVAYKQLSSTACAWNVGEHEAGVSSCKHYQHVATHGLRVIWYV